MSTESEETQTVPFQYKNNGNYIIVFTDSLEEFKVIQDYYSNIESPPILVRGLESKNNKMESGIIEYYMDELNEEDFIKNSKGIIYLYNFRLCSNNFFNYVQENNIPFYVHSTFESGRYETLNDNKMEHINTYMGYNKKDEIERIERIEGIEGIDGKKEVEKKIKIVEESNIKGMGNDSNQKLHLLTYIRRMEGNDSYYQLQIKCVLENYKHNLIQDMIVVGKNIEETFKNINFEKIEGKRLILINDDDDNITFYDMFLMANEIFKDKMVILMRSDIILLQTQTDMLSFYFMFIENSKMMLAMSRIERETSGRLIRLTPQNTLYDSMGQDAWIMKTPILIEENELIMKYDFNEIHSELYMNTYLIEKGYKIQNNINDLKIIRLSINNNLMVRDLIKRNSHPLNLDKITLLPEYGFMSNVTVENLLQMINSTDEDIYQYKMELMNKMLKKKLLG